MDVLAEEFLSFWKKLNDNSVQYVMVGGLAVRFHGFNRNTDDLDIWIKDTLDNRRNFRKAFIELGYGDYESIETMQFVSGWTSFYAAGVELDIMTEMKGLEEASFEDCYKLAAIADLNGIKVPFLHINHLLENKKAVNRPKDQIDVIYLEKIKQLLQDEENKKKDQS